LTTNHLPKSLYRAVPAMLLVLTAFAAAAAAGPTTSATASEAGAFGVTPVELKFQTPGLLRGSQVEGIFHVQNRQAQDLLVTAAPDGAAASWITVDPSGAFLVPAGDARDVKVKVTVPADAANGDYVSYLRIRAAPPGSFEGSGSSVAMELVPAVRLRVGGEQQFSLSFDSLDVKEAEAGRPLALLARLVNTGNVRAEPLLELTVRDDDGNLVMSETMALGALAPREGLEAPLLTKNTIPRAGSYDVTATLKAAGGSFGDRAKSFEAVAAGASKARFKSGLLAGLEADEEAEAGSPVKVAALFKNNGAERIDSAVMKGEVFLNGKRVALLASDPLMVAQGTEEALEAFWTPKSGGVYRIEASVTYDGMKTALKSIMVTVAGPEATTEQPHLERDTTTPGTTQKEAPSTRVGASTTGEKEAPAGTPVKTVDAVDPAPKGDASVPAEGAKNEAPAGAVVGALAALGGAAVAFRRRSP